MNKKNIIYWINIVVLMINVAFFSFYFSENETDIIYKQSEDVIDNEFLKEELGFSDEQYNLVMEMDSLIMIRHNNVLRLLCERRYQMFNELAKPNPSTDTLKSICTSIGQLHRALKIQTVWHLLNIKKVCTPEQTEKLEKIFMEVLELEKYCKSCPNNCTAEQKNCRRCATFHPYNENDIDSILMLDNLNPF